MIEKRYYWGLDAMRGLAALAVVFGHVEHRYALSSHLAVDFFFMLSGFVIADAYGVKLHAGLGVRRFMGARLRRLYPLYLIGGLLGIAQLLILNNVGAITVAPADLVISSIFNLSFLPSPSALFVSPALRGVFPINGPAWSMSWEMAINLAFAVSIFRLNTNGLIALCAVGAIALVSAGIYHGDLNFGWDRPYWWGAVPRVTFSFSVGVLMHRFIPQLPRIKSWLSGLAPAVLVVCMVVRPEGVVRTAFDLAFCLIIAPLLLAVGALVEVPDRLVTASKWLGYISYPVYITHRPLFGVYEWVMHNSNLRASIYAGLFVSIAVIFAMAVSLAVDRLTGRRMVRARLGTGGPSSGRG